MLTVPTLEAYTTQVQVSERRRLVRTFKLPHSDTY